MFTKYWRSYPWFLQLFLFVATMLIIMSLGIMFMQRALPSLTGIPLKELLSVNAESSARVVQVAHYAQIIGNLTLFTIPCLLFAYLTHPKPFQYLGLRKPGKPVQWLLVAGIMIGFLFTSLYLQEWVSRMIRFPKWMQDMQQQNNSQFQGMLSLKSFGGFMLMFFTMAILPPLGEELMFRGILFRFSHKSTKKIVPSMIITAAFFMLMHPNPQGAVFIFSAGLLLAGIYYLTGSLWCSIFAHFLYNGIQVVYSYWANNHLTKEQVAAATGLPVYAALAGAVLFGFSFYALLKNKTPLAANWTDDYLGENKTAEIHQP
jgi:membrane protease YdiL (CAAX protease family)